MNLVYLRSYVENEAITLTELVSAANYRYYSERLLSYVGHVGTDWTAAREGTCMLPCSCDLSFSFLLPQLHFYAPGPGSSRTVHERGVNESVWLRLTSDGIKCLQGTRRKKAHFGRGCLLSLIRAGLGHNSDSLRQIPTKEHIRDRKM